MKNKVLFLILVAAICLTGCKNETPNLSSLFGVYVATDGSTLKINEDGTCIWPIGLKECSWENYSSNEIRFVLKPEGLEEKQVICSLNNHDISCDTYYFEKK